MTPMRLREATSDADLQEIRRLFLTYAGSLGISLCFQNFEQELAGLPGAYSPPNGCLLLADFGGVAGGCVGLRPLQNQACEMKRLFVAPEFRGSGAGRALVLAVMDKARSLRYTSFCLDTLPMMMKAIELYKQLGFTPIEPYYENPVPGALFLECKL
jgi:putative acetyltransferase